MPDILDVKRMVLIHGSRGEVYLELCGKAKQTCTALRGLRNFANPPIAAGGRFWIEYGLLACVLLRAFKGLPMKTSPV